MSLEHLDLKHWASLVYFGGFARPALELSLWGWGFEGRYGHHCYLSVGSCFGQGHDSVHSGSAG